MKVWRRHSNKNVNTTTTVVIVRSRTIQDDGRVMRIATSLAKHYRVRILSWDRDRKHNRIEVIEPNITVDYLGLRAPYSSVSLVLYLPLFWLWVLVKLFTIKPAIVHACDFDTVIPCYVYKVVTRAKLIFDSFDKYSLSPAMLYLRNKLITKLVDVLENVFALKSDALIIVSKNRLKVYGNFIPSRVRVIMNCADETIFEHARTRKTKKMQLISLLIEKLHNEGKVVLVYAGNVSKDRGLLLIMKALEEFNNIYLVVGGKPLDDTVTKLLKASKVYYVGPLSYHEVIALESQADIIVALYDPSVPLNRLASPNKIFEAMMLGKPIITNVCDEIINDCKCGIITKYDVDDIAKAIRVLVDNPRLRKKLGEAGRRAFLRKYNWSVMEKILLYIYRELEK